MGIESMSSLDALETQIGSMLARLKLGDVMRSLWLLSQESTGLNPFMIAGLSMFAMRFCPPSKTSQLIKSCNIAPLINLSNEYLLGDPITFDESLREEFESSNPAFLVLRIVSSQFPYEVEVFSEFARPFYLYYEIPRQLHGQPGIPDFDFESTFFGLHGFTTLDFVTTGFVVYAASKSGFSLNRDYLLNARKKGIKLPAPKILRLILDQLSADKVKFTSLYEKRKNLDRRFRMYDFNPLISYPLIKPCQNKQFATSGKDFFHSPVPGLIGSRISAGIFYDMYNAHSTASGNIFSEFFGYVFEAYVGLVLKNCIQTETLLSEVDIRKFYPSNKGKVSDWIWMDGSSLILIECKATRFSRAAQSIASEEAVNSSLAQVRKGLKQLHDFMSACCSKSQELAMFHKCSTFRPILVTLEPLHLVNNTFFREHINGLLAQDGITGMDWQILSVDELEALQPHLATGFKLIQVLNDLQTKTFNKVLDGLVSRSQKSFVDSFLYQKQQELYCRLGLRQATYQ
jgi:hypothetical protein